VPFGGRRVPERRLFQTRGAAYGNSEVSLDIEPATPEAAAAAAKQRLDQLLSADYPDWHTIELTADDLGTAAALALEQQPDTAGTCSDVSSQQQRSG
jgi:hypothetical protein